MPDTLTDELGRLWEVESLTQREITRLTLLEVLNMVEAAAPNTVTSIEVICEETMTWTFTVDDDDRGVHTVEAYDVTTASGNALCDELWSATPWFWQYLTDLLVPYTETAYVEVDKHLGMLEGAIFTPERIRTPHTPQEVEALEQQRIEQYRRDAEAQREQYRRAGYYGTPTTEENA